MKVIFLKCQILMFFFLFWNVKDVKADLMVNVKMAILSKTCTEKTHKYFSKGSFYSLNNHGRHGLLSFLSSLPISVLRNLELEAYKFYIRASKLYKSALITRCYVQHFLSPYIDFEVNHKQHFIKIPFINKGIEFIDLHSIFKDNIVICLFVFVALRPKSTAMVIAGRSVHLTTLFPGQA